MIVYVSVNFIIIILGLYLEIINSTTKQNPFRKRLPNYFFVIPSFILLFVVSAFRGDFATDYNNYVYLFNLYNRYELREIFQIGLYQEAGFIFFTRVIAEFTSNELYLFVITSFIILYCFYSQISKYSSYIWLSVLMFVTIGSFYTSFNIMRQILAVALIFAGSKYLYDRSFFKYLLVVLLAALFHKTALIMIVFYFILNLKFSPKNLFVLFSAAIISMLYLDTFLAFIQQYFYSVYTESVYGMTGLSFTNAILPLGILIFCLFHSRKIDLNNITDKIWLNAVIFYAFFSILGLKVEMIQRISEFFAPFALLLIPLIFSRIKSDELKIIYMMGFISLLVLYNYITLSGSGYDPYYFIWESPPKP